MNPGDVIDDLIKFRIVESLLRQGDVSTTAGDLASKLGFRSVEITGLALDDLVDAGVLRANREGADLQYRLVSDSQVRADIQQLIAQGPPGLFNRLALGSIHRIKRLLRKHA